MCPLDELIAIRRAIHSNPELSFKEHATSALVRSELEKCGIELLPCNGPTGVLGILHGAKEGRHIALRADMDALPMEEKTGLPFASQNPSVCHSCGHDMHTTALIGAARLLSQKREQLHGSVTFIFQPAEETARGALTMIESGAMNGVQAVFCLHSWPDLPAGSIGYRKGPLMAGADGFKIQVTGKGGHAAYPHRCVDPIVVCSSLVMQLQTLVSRETSPLESAVISVCKILAGTAGNIIPESAEMEGTLRTLTVENAARLKESIRRVATHGALSLNAVAEVEFLEGLPPVNTDPALVTRAVKMAQALLGEAQVVELETPSMGGEDFAEYLKFAPGALFRLGTHNEDSASRLPLHSPHLIFDERALATGATFLSALACEMTHPQTQE